MANRRRIVSIVGFASIWLVSETAAASVWSIEADCEDGDWNVEVSLDGFESIDASCVDGEKTRVRIEARTHDVPTARVAATSATGTSCEGGTGGEPRFKLGCSEKVEGVDGLEWEEELEVELELEALERGREDDEEAEHR